MNFYIHISYFAFIDTVAYEYVGIYPEDIRIFELITVIELMPVCFNPYFPDGRRVNLA